MSLYIFRVAEYIASYVERARLSILFLPEMHVRFKPKTRVVLLFGNGLPFRPGGG